MPSVRINEEELEAMRGLPHFARSLYVFGIRPYMDFRTGLVGVVRGVSWQSLAEAVYVEPHQGEQDSGTPDKSRVRRAAARLEKAGLVVIRSEGKRLIFQCLLADSDSSVSNKPDTNPTQTRHTYPDTANTNNGAVWRQQPDTNPTYPEQAKADTPPVSGIRSSNSNELLVASGADDAQPSRRADAKGKGATPCPHQEIIELYHELLPANPRIRDWTPARQAHLRARWNEDPSRQDLDWWRRFFTWIGDNCPFLIGQRTGRGDKPFLPGLDWMVKAENFAKIREGRYEENAA